MNRVTRVLNDIYWGFRKTTRVVNRVPTRVCAGWNRDAEGGRCEAQGGKRGGLHHGSPRARMLNERLWRCGLFCSQAEGAEDACAQGQQGDCARFGDNMIKPQVIEAIAYSWQVKPNQI